MAETMKPPAGAKRWRKKYGKPSEDLTEAEVTDVPRQSASKFSGKQEALEALLSALDTFDIPRQSALDFLAQSSETLRSLTPIATDPLGIGPRLIPDDADFRSELTRIGTDPLSYTPPARVVRGASALKQLREAMDEGQEAVDRLPDEIKAAALAESEASLLPKE